MNIHFSDVAVQKIENLATDTGATSHAEVVRYALALYERIIQGRKDGWKLQLVKGDRAADVVLPPFDKE